MCWFSILDENLSKIENFLVPKQSNWWFKALPCIWNICVLCKSVIHQRIINSLLTQCVYNTVFHRKNIFLKLSEWAAAKRVQTSKLMDARLCDVIVTFIQGYQRRYRRLWFGLYNIPTTNRSVILHNSGSLPI